jgi:hypothetical protein
MSSSTSSMVRSAAPAGERNSSTARHRSFGCGSHPGHVGRDLRSVEGHSPLEGSGGHSVGLVVDDNQPFVVLVHEVDDALQHAVTDDRPDVPLPPVRPKRSPPDYIGVQGRPSQRSDDVGMLGNTFGEYLGGDGIVESLTCG